MLIHYLKLSSPLLRLLQHHEGLRHPGKTLSFTLKITDLYRLIRFMHFYFQSKPILESPRGARIVFACEDTVLVLVHFTK